MASHAELVSELAGMDKMPMSERLKLAKKRRSAQLKAYAQYEKQLNKNASRRGKKSVTSGSAVPACSSSSSSNRARNQLRFSDSVLLLDATVRNDVDEGTAWCFILYSSCNALTRNCILGCFSPVHSVRFIPFFSPPFPFSLCFSRLKVAL